MVPTIQLTPEQLAHFREEGWLAIDQISSPEELAALRDIYDRLFAEKAGRERGAQFDLAGSDEDGEEAKLPQILGPSEFAPEMRDTLAWANAKAIMSQLLGAEISWQGDHAILKPAHWGAPTPWHQDEAYWDPGFDHRNLSVWMPLQDVDEAAGCLHFVSRSHLNPVQEHQPIGGDPRVHGLETLAPVPMESATAVPLQAGGCTIHQQRTLHYAPANQSDQPRRAWIIMGGLPGTGREEPHDYHWQNLWQTARMERERAAQDQATAKSSGE